MAEKGNHYQGRVEQWKAGIGSFYVGHEVDGLVSETDELREAYDNLDWSMETVRAWS
jgi:hypothetical protein